MQYIIFKVCVMSECTDKKVSSFCLPPSLVGYRFKETIFYAKIAKCIAISIKEVGMENIDQILGKWTAYFLPSRKKNKFDRLVSPTFIRRRLVKLVLRESLQHEQISREIGGKSHSSYVGEGTLNLRKKMLSASLEFLQSKTINTVSGIKPLIELSMDSRKRFNELYVMNLGMQHLAEELGYKAVFLTITAPAEFHPNPTSGKHSWNGCYAKDAHLFINKKWEAFGKDLSSKTNKIFKSKGDLFGFRVVEPHKDGTPHWHILMYVDPKHVNKTIKLCYKHFSHSYKALKVELIRPKSEDPNAASPTSYMTKYLVKSIGLKDYIKDIKADGEDVAEYNALEKIDAWRSATGIRAYQKFGILAGVTKWRFLRKMYNAYHTQQARVIDNPSEQLSIEGQGYNISSKIILAMRQCNTKLYKKNNENSKRAFADFLISIKEIESSGLNIYFKEKYKNKYKEECERIVGLYMGCKLLVLNSFKLIVNSKLPTANAVYLSISEYINMENIKVGQLNTIIQVDRSLGTDHHKETIINYNTT